MSRRSSGVEKNPHIVEERMIGNTRVRIADDYCVSQEEADKIMKRLAETLRPILAAQAKTKAETA